MLFSHKENFLPPKNRTLSFKISCLVYILVKTARDKTRTRVWRVHSSCLPYSRPVLISFRISQRHVGKSVSSQMEWECLECLASLSTILAREYECLHSCVLHLVHISPKVSTNTRNENLPSLIFYCGFGPDKVVIKKNFCFPVQNKCIQYWPPAESPKLELNEVDLRVELVSEKELKNYTVRNIRWAAVC